MPRLPGNPFMSLWMSAAHRVANTGRGIVMAQARRHQASVTAAASRSVERFWTEALRGTNRRKDR